MFMGSNQPCMCLTHRALNVTDETTNTRAASSAWVNPLLMISVARQEDVNLVAAKFIAVA